MYETFFDFDSAPFQLTPNPRFFFDSGTHRRALLVLRHALQKNESLTVITGNSGSGKTELLRYFASELDNNSILVSHISLSKIRSTNITQYIAAAFGVVDMGLGSDALLGKIKCDLTTRSSERKKFVLLVDDAHALTPHAWEVLADLCALNLHGDAQVQCFLFGENSLLNIVKRLEAVCLLQVNSAYQLGQLNETETQHYIEHRLLQAGWRGDPVISSGAYQLLYRISAGIPWHVNLICHRVLLQASLQETHEIGEELVRLFHDTEQLDIQEVQHSVVNGSINSVNPHVPNRVTANVAPLTRNEAQDKTVTPGSSASNTVTSITALSAGQKNRSKNERSGDITLSVLDVQSAFNDAISLEQTHSKSGFADKKLAIDDDSDDEQRKGTLDIETSIQTRTRDRVLDRILPETTTVIERAMWQLSTQPAVDQSLESPVEPEFDDRGEQCRVYPLLNMPGQGKLVGVTGRYFDDDTGNARPRLSTGQIALNASIITSLVITLIIMVLSEIKTSSDVYANNTLPNATSGQSRPAKNLLNIMESTVVDSVKPFTTIR